MKFGQAVSEEKMFEKCGRRRQRRRTTEHGYTTFGSGELKKTTEMFLKQQAHEEILHIIA